MSQEKRGRFIREIRIGKEMTQQELAEKIGVTDRAISKWETGRGTPDITFLIPLSKELDVTILELLSGEKIENENNAIIDLIKQKDKKTKIWKYLFTGISNIVLLIMSIILMFGYIIPIIYENSNTKGLELIRSGSMEPTIETLSGFIYDKVDIENVKKDDIIVFNWVDENGAFLVSENGHIRVVHRVVDITKDDNGNISLITRGDNNLVDDSMSVTSHNFVGVYNHKTTNLTAVFLRHNIRRYPIVFIILITHVIGIVIFDIIQLKKYYFNK